MRKSENPESEEIKAVLFEMGEKARIASYELAAMTVHAKNECLMAMAAMLESSTDEILAANEKDMRAGMENAMSVAMLDRLRLSHERISEMAQGLRNVVSLEDPVGRRLSTVIRPNGLKIEKISVPIGVIGIIYESRPNVTVDAAGLCLKAGNAVILRGGSEAINSNIALARALHAGGTKSGLPDGAVQLIPWTSREAVQVMLKMNQYINLIIPRGGESLIKTVVENSTIPVIKHYKGVCHIYVDCEYDADMALRIIENAKCQRPGVCNSIEKLLINESILNEFGPKAAQLLTEKGVELRGDEKFCSVVPSAIPASDSDWSEEYLGLVITVGVVNDVEEAIYHINKWSSSHSDGIVTANPQTAEKFLNGIDSAAVYWNASTRFTDGGEFGMGAEIGISTDKIHARGPMGLPELNTYKYLVIGNGQIRD
ncbi:MAG: glutamate-5-semialdehyde dehydrogenase [Lentisphaerae bacterium GWF2_45_14]|nr:MAG: glutamate-5-semialdehyde dehydrogenase [Lentisphaerae bacterium GWF2_45_14]